MPSFTWSTERIRAFEAALAKRPHFSRFNHVSVWARDVEVSKRFYADVLGGRVVNEGTPHFAEVEVAGVIIGMSDVRGVGAPAEAEFPHIAFEIESDQFLPMKKWLEDHGVKTHEPWTRHQVEGLMYFKDPAGNLIEVYCPKFAGAKELRTSGTPIGVVDLAGLDYEWDPALAEPVLT
ncbi:MAG: VOC family protein [Candidatus Lustribacter sp.]|jgi:catechol 2,3-dioxygenase-like lactoylglutathione lyase family enzyme